LPSSGKKQASTLAKENENDEKDLLSVEPKLELWFSNGGSRSFRRAEGRNIWHSIFGLNYFEAQAYGGYWW